jgi:hypothetical protein
MPTPIASSSARKGVSSQSIPRNYGRGETVYYPWHYVPVLARKPGALRNGAPFKDWVLPSALERVRRKLAESDDGDRQMVAILGPKTPLIKTDTCLFFEDNRGNLKENSIRIVRDKTAFCYDKLNLGEAIHNLAPHENTVYLAEHPAKALYYFGSATVFRTIFAMIADKAG